MPTESALHSVLLVHIVAVGKEALHSVHVILATMKLHLEGNRYVKVSHLTIFKIVL